MTSKFLIAGLALASLPLIAAHSQPAAVGAVFAATNNAAANSIIMYARAADGTLRRVGQFPTFGRGVGGYTDALGSAGSVLLSPDHRFLLVVNAGSSNITVFRVLPDALVPVSLTPSGGGNPISLAMHANLVYVVNAAGEISVVGFRFEPSGRLTPLANPGATLSSPFAAASTVAISPDGAKLVVTERLTNKIDVFSIGADGSLSNPVFNASQGQTPFSVNFQPGGRQMLVTEAALVSGAVGSTSSYDINPDNTLAVISSSATASGLATCWLATNGAYAWVTNSATSNLGAYAVSRAGALTPLGVQATLPPIGPVKFPAFPPTSFPLDLALSQDGHFLYSFFSVNGQIVGYQVNGGGLTAVTSVAPERPQTGAEGLAAY